MNEKLKELAKRAYEDVNAKTPSFLITKEMVDARFAELILQAASDHIMESSDRYRKEYFADRVLKTFEVNDGNGS